MSSNRANRIITWAQFEVCNSDHCAAFEIMCRSLFNRYFFENKALFHSNPNNPGIEIEPINDAASGKRVSFQAKYFSTVDYSQIKHSAEQTVKHYAGKIDIIYLYCNRDLTKTSKQYVEIEQMLFSNSIELKPICNQTIIDQVINYDVIASLYFNKLTLSDKWFSEKLSSSLDLLGPRYNRNFNVGTKTEEYIDLFMHSKEAAIYINNMKNDAVAEIAAVYEKCHFRDATFDGILSAISSINDITADSILQCLDWPHLLVAECLDEVAGLKQQIREKKEYLTTQYDTLKRTEKNQLENNIENLSYLADFSSLFGLSNIEKGLLTQKTLIVNGEAGIGKSQLFANAAEKRLLANGCAVLLVGHTLLSSDPICFQIPLNLGLNIDFDEFLAILEGLGEAQQKLVILFIDAINESAYKEIWKNGLGQLIGKIETYNFVRLAISVRTGYEKLVFNDTVQSKIGNCEIVYLSHSGFREDSIQATMTFLNYYGIPFAPSYFLQYEMTNPLFLTLFCKTYDGKEFDLFTLFEKLIGHVDAEAQKAVGLDGTTVIVKYLVNEIAETMLRLKKRSINKKVAFELTFWETYGLTHCKIPFMNALVRTGLLLETAYEDTEFFFLGYNLLEDFICAKVVISQYPNNADLLTYLEHDLLKIEHGQIINFSNQDIFIIVCSLYTEKYGEECFEAIVDTLLDETYKQSAANRYAKSFLWRKSSTVNSDAFINFLNKYGITPDTVWQIFIESSVKPNHSLNAELLHSVLINKTIAHRDYIWTTIINGFINDEDRLYQLIIFFDKGNTLNGFKDENIILLLILFSWLLTSSNRVLRDKTSKAMIEILKVNFQMCKPLLERFESVNDPYVLQRLYGVVFGACMKRRDPYVAEFKELAVYIFHTIFNCDTVYPDILLRDYARLILERYLYEFPMEKSFVDAKKIKPPYRSDDIPIVEEYNNNREFGGFGAIVSSMHPDRIDGPGMYGDFGRYVFQSALSAFDGIDIKNLYYYALHFIRNELGYTDELFKDYDTFSARRHYNRHETKKIERIGKKYQWIAMYNILARVADRCLLKEWGDGPSQYEGAWNPYVRDFDPTLNINFLKPPELPSFASGTHESDEFIADLSATESTIKDWANWASPFFNTHASKLMIKDASGQFWILLNQYEDMDSLSDMADRKTLGYKNGSQSIWSMSHGYIVREIEFMVFKNELEQKNFMGKWFPEGCDIYQLFNREYVWSPGYLSMFNNPWVDYESMTGEKIITKQVGLLPVFSHHSTDEYDNLFTLEEQEWEQVEDKTVILGQVMPACSRLLWEESCDASQDDTTAFDVPCKDILDYLQLSQKEYDGYYYSANGDLVVFDGRLAKTCAGLLIRKDYLEKYLYENDLRFFWTVLGEKQFFKGNRDQVWSEWSGFFYLENGKVVGSMNRHDPKRY